MKNLQYPIKKYKQTYAYKILMNKLKKAYFWVLTVNNLSNTKLNEKVLQEVMFNEAEQYIKERIEVLCSESKLSAKEVTCLFTNNECQLFLICIVLKNIEQMAENCTEQRRCGKRRCGKSYSQIWKKY